MRPEIPASYFVPRETSDVISDDEVRKLTRGMVQGCEASWASFFDGHQQRLRGYLRACWKGESAVVDDLLQETLLRVVKHIRVFESAESLWSWLTVLARSTVVDQGRRTGRFRRLLECFRIERVVTPPSDEVLAKARTELSSANRQLIRLKYDDELTVVEIASVLGVSTKVVESRLTRARKKLKKIYLKYEDR